MDFLFFFECKMQEAGFPSKWCAKETYGGMDNTRKQRELFQHGRDFDETKIWKITMLTRLVRATYQVISW